MAVLNPDGSVNTNSNFNFGTVVFGYVVALAVDYADNVYVAYRGYTSGDGVARLRPNLSGGWDLDSAFSDNIKPRLRNVQTIAVGGAPHANVFVSGSITNNGAWHPLAEFTEEGNFVTTADFSPLGILSSGILQIVYRPAGAAIINGVGYTWPERLLIAGTFGVASVWMDESIYSSYPPLDSVFSCVAERPNEEQLLCPGPHGELLAGGQTAPYIQYGLGVRDSYRHMSLERLGSADSTNFFAPISHSRNFPADDGENIARIVALPDGDMLVAGYFSFIRGQPVNNLAHLLPNGSVDTTFQNVAGFPVMDLARQPDGKYVLVGKSNFTPLTGQIMRLQPLPAAGVNFSSQPQNQTVYEGDSVSFAANVTAWPGMSAQWTKDGNALSGKTNTSLHLSAVTTDAAGAYQLAAQNQSFCPIAALSSTAVLTVLAAPAPPPNDLCSSATPLTGLVATGRGTLRGATFEPGEAEAPPFYAGRSVWWTWTAPFSGQVLVDVSGCDFPAAIGIFTGEQVGTLTVVTNNYDYGVACECAGFLTDFAFEVTAGKTYRIAIGGIPNVGSLGDIRFSLAPGGSAWMSANSGITKALRAVAAGNGRIVAVGDNGTIVTSADAVHWTTATTPTANGLRGIAFGHGTFVATGAGGGILTSTNGLDWEQQTSGTSQTLESVAFGNGTFVAVATGDLVLNSTNGVNWALGTTGTDAYLIGAAFANGLFFAETPGAVLYSSDGAHWSAGSVPISDYFYSTAYGNQMFVSAGAYGAIVTSTNGIDWTQAASGPGFSGITFGSGRFVAVGDHGVVEISTDGTPWVQDNARTASALNAVTGLDDGRFVAVGDRGLVLVSQPPRIGPWAWQPEGKLQFGLTALSGSKAIIQAATTIASPDWQPLATNVIVRGMTIFSDSSASPARFYRAVVLP